MPSFFSVQILHTCNFKLIKFLLHGKFFTFLRAIFQRGAQTLKLIMWPRVIVIETCHLFDDATLVSIFFSLLTSWYCNVHENIGKLDHFCLKIWFCQLHWQHFIFRHSLQQHRKILIHFLGEIDYLMTLVFFPMRNIFLIVLIISKCLLLEDK